MNFDKMTDKQIADYVMNCDNLDTISSFRWVTEYRDRYDNPPKLKDVYRLVRKALKEGKTFKCAYDDGESCAGPRQSCFEMWIE